MVLICVLKYVPLDMLTTPQWCASQSAPQIQIFMHIIIHCWVPYASYIAHLYITDIMLLVNALLTAQHPYIFEILWQWLVSSTALIIFMAILTISSALAIVVWLGSTQICNQVYVYQYARVRCLQIQRLSSALLSVPLAISVKTTLVSLIALLVLLILLQKSAN